MDLNAVLQFIQANKNNDAGQTLFKSLISNPSNLASLFGGGQNAGGAGAIDQGGGLKWDTEDSIAQQQQAADDAKKQAEADAQQAEIDQKGTFEGHIDNRNDIEKTVGGIFGLGGLVGLGGNILRAPAAATQAVAGDVVGAISNLGNVDHAKGSFVNPLDNAVNAFQDNGKAQDLGDTIQTATGNELDPTAKKILNGVGSIGLDPTNIIPGLGLLSKADKATKAAKAIEDASKLADVTNGAGDLSKVADVATTATRAPIGMDVTRMIGKAGGQPGLESAGFSGKASDIENLADKTRQVFGTNVASDKFFNNVKDASTAFNTTFQKKLASIGDSATADAEDLKNSIVKSIHDAGLTNPSAESNVTSEMAGIVDKYAVDGKLTPENLYKAENEVRDLIKTNPKYKTYGNDTNIAGKSAQYAFGQAFDNVLSQVPGGVQFSTEDLNNIAKAAGTTPEKLTTVVNSVGSNGDIRGARQFFKFADNLGEAAKTSRMAPGKLVSAQDIPAKAADVIAGDKAAALMGAFKRGNINIGSAAGKVVDLGKGAGNIVKGAVVNPLTKGAYNIGKNVPSIPLSINKFTQGPNENIDPGLAAIAQNSGGSNKTSGGGLSGLNDIDASTLFGAGDNQKKLQTSYFNDQLAKGMTPSEAATAAKMNYPTLTSQEQKQLTAMGNAINAVKSLESSYSQAKGLKGLGGGTVTDIFGGLGLDQNASTYNSDKSGFLSNIVRALGESGALSDSDRETAQKLLPSFSDSDGTAKTEV
jgi:hypothetical protein